MILRKHYLYKIRPFYGLCAAVVRAEVRAGRRATDAIRGTTGRRGNGASSTTW